MEVSGIVPFPRAGNDSQLTQTRYSDGKRARHVSTRRGCALACFGWSRSDLAAVGRARARSPALQFGLEGRSAASALAENVLRINPRTFSNHVVVKFIAQPCDQKFRPLRWRWFEGGIVRITEIELVEFDD